MFSIIRNLVKGGRLIIIGAGAFGHEIASYAEEIFHKLKDYKTKIMFIDDWEGAKSENPEWLLLDSSEWFQGHKDDTYIIGLGDPKKRQVIAERYHEHEFNWATLVHPTAHVSDYAVIEPGCIVGPFATVSYRAVVSEHVVLNSYTAVGHHVQIGPYSVLSPKTLLAGKSVLEGANFIGSGSVVTPGRRIAYGARVSAGSVVYRNVKEGFTVLGNPAKVISKSAPKNNLD